jgi:hypothetical protein
MGGLGADRGVKMAAEFPLSRRALKGLSQALRHLGKNAEADQIDQEFQDAWKHADVALDPGNF